MYNNLGELAPPGRVCALQRLERLVAGPVGEDVAEGGDGDGVVVVDGRVVAQASSDAQHLEWGGRLALYIYVYVYIYVDVD